MSKPNQAMPYLHRMQVFCLPYSGGSAYAFQPLMAYFSKSWEVTTLAYPGRGSRFADPLVYTMEALIEDSWLQIKDKLHAPYILFGHSLGSTLAYLLAHKAIQEGKPPPVYLLLAGTDGPSVPSKLPHRYLYSKTDFKHKLKSYGGISQEILNDEAAFDFFEPIVRADFQVVETCKYSKKPKLDIPAMVVTGKEEDMTESEIQAWQEEFSGPISFRKMEGPHFFLFKNPKQFVSLMQQDIQIALAKVGEI